MLRPGTGWRAGTAAALVLLMAPHLGVASPGAEATGGERRIDLRELLAIAADRYPEVDIAEAEKRGAEALESQARWTRWTPKLTGGAVAGLVPAARGNILYSPDSPRDLNDLGPFWRFRLDMSQPFLTWGKLGAAQHAAENLVASKQSKVESKRNTGRSLASKAYFEFLLAQDRLKLISEVKLKLDELVGRLQNPPPGEPETDQMDLYKARSYEFKIARLEAGAARELEVASAGLNELVGLPAGGVVRPRAQRLEPIEVPPPDLDKGISEALTTRSDIKEVTFAAEAQRLWAHSVSRDRYPTFGLEMRFEYGEARNRDKQDNPFVYEPFNVRTIAWALAGKWDLNFLQSGARTEKELAYAAELRAQREALSTRSEIEVVQAHAELIEAQKLLETSRKELSTTANWARVAEDNYGLGTSNIDDLVAAYGAAIESRASQLEAIRNLNIAVIAWRLALGRAPLLEGESP